MNNIVRSTALFLSLFGCTACLGQANNATSATQEKKEITPTMHAKGPFEVKLSPQTSPELPQGVISRMSIEKTFHGDLEGSSKGEMLAAGSGAKGSSGGYVALEQVTGTLNGRKGTFVLQHNATMTQGVPWLFIIVVPGSGTDQLAGLSGTMNIVITEGKHSYDFEYTLPDSEPAAH
jgi:Protein of unknown function (DUF3224)